MLFLPDSKAMSAEKYHRYLWRFRIFDLRKIFETSEISAISAQRTPLKIFRFGATWKNYEAKEPFETRMCADRIAENRQRLLAQVATAMALAGASLICSLKKETRTLRAQRPMFEEEYRILSANAFKEHYRFAQQVVEYSLTLFFL